VSAFSQPRLSSVTVNHGATFEDWCASLNRWSAKYGYSGGIVQQTGADCWRDYYDEGYTPDEALREDKRNG
jgi:hypothetical protein